MANNFALPAVGTASSQGPRICNADAVWEHRWADVLAVAVVDGAGDTHEAADAAVLVAEVAVRVGARKGVLAGVLTAADLLADPTSDGVKLDHRQLTTILRDHDFEHADPFLCASAVLAAAEQVGTRDNASVAVIVHPAARRDG